MLDARLDQHRAITRAQRETVRLAAMPCYLAQALPDPGRGARDPAAFYEAQGACRGQHFDEPGFVDYTSREP
eukprot:10614914-Lingulodinium_polyedra.AAC.1